MNRWLWPLELTLVVTLGAWWAGPLAAQVPTAPAPVLTGNPVVIQAYAIVPVVPHDATPPNAVPPPEPERGPIGKFYHQCCTHVKSFARSMGFCCWDTHNSVGCGNITTDLTFMFGSCRQFFGEPCMLPPPPGSPGRPVIPGSGSGSGPGGATDPGNGGCGSGTGGSGSANGGCGCN